MLYARHSVLGRDGKTVRLLFAFLTRIRCSPGCPSPPTRCLTRDPDLDPQQAIHLKGSPSTESLVRCETGLRRRRFLSPRPRGFTSSSSGRSSCIDERSHSSVAAKALVFLLVHWWVRRQSWAACSPRHYALSSCAFTASVVWFSIAVFGC